MRKIPTDNAYLTLSESAPSPPGKKMTATLPKTLYNAQYPRSLTPGAADLQYSASCLVWIK